MKNRKPFFLDLLCSQIIYDLELYMLDMLWILACVGLVPKFAQSYRRNLVILFILCYCEICLDDFCSLKYNYFLALLLDIVLLC
jgi:hypothetical protein